MRWLFSGRLLLGVREVASARRRVAALLAAILTATLLGAPGADPAAAQGARRLPPTILLDTPCGPFVTPDPDGVIPNPDVTVTVRGFDWTPRAAVDLFFDPQPGTEEPEPDAVATPDDYGFFVITFFVTQPGAEGTYRVEAREQGADDGGASASYRSPCAPTVTLTPTCGPAAGSDPAVTEYVIRVVGDHFEPDWPLELRFLNQAEEELYRADPVSDPAGHFEHEFRHPTLPAGLYGVIVAEGDLMGVAVALFNVPCPPQTILVTPDCGDPGQPPDRYALRVSGTGWVPNRTVVILFDAFGSTEGFAYPFDVPESGSWEIDIEPGRRPEGQYWIRALQSLGRTPTAIAAQPFGPTIEALTVFTVPCPPQPVPVISVDPDCGSPAFVGDPVERRYEITVRGSDFTPGQVRITFDADRRGGIDPAEDTFFADVLGDGTFATVITARARAGSTVPYRVVAEQLDGDAVFASAEASFAVPCERARPRLRRSPDCGVDGRGGVVTYSIGLRGRRFLPGFVEIVFDESGVPEAFSGAADRQGMLSATITPSGRPPGTYTIVARQRDVSFTWAEASVDFTVPCDTPTIVIRPGAGEPGYVCFVDGAGFPADTVVTLTWDRGIGAGIPREVTSDAAGAFRLGILIFHHDFLGTRELSAGLPGDPSAFRDARATFTVLAGQGSPPSVPIVDPFTGIEQMPIVDRR